MAVKALTEAMNDQLAAEYQAVIQYVQYSAVVTGPHRRELVAFFQLEIPDELIHAQYLAEKIAALGATPTTTAKAIPHADEPRKMLENVASAESEAVAAYTRLIGLAEAAGEISIRVQMETFVQDEANHRDETRKILKGDW